MPPDSVTLKCRPNRLSATGHRPKVSWDLLARSLKKSRASSRVSKKSEKGIGKNSIRYVGNFQRWKNPRVHARRPSKAKRKRRVRPFHWPRNFLADWFSLKSNL